MRHNARVLGINMALRDGEIVDKLRRYAISRKSRGSLHRVPVTCLAAHARVSRPTFYKWLTGGKIKERYRPGIGIMLWGLEMGTLRFERHRQKWQAVRSQPPEVPPPAQDKMTRAEEWNQWAACRTCAARSWAPAYSAGRALMVCSHCIPASQYAGLGLTRQQ